MPDQTPGERPAMSPREAADVMESLRVLWALDVRDDAALAVLIDHARTPAGDPDRGRAAERIRAYLAAWDLTGIADAVVGRAYSEDAEYDLRIADLRTLAPPAPTVTREAVIESKELP